MLADSGGPDQVDLVVADHGFAGAAIEAGIPTLAIADVNDLALPLAQARGRTDSVIVLDDGLDASRFVPVTEAVIGAS
ncbi:MAG: phosphatase, partial [Actinomycetota bacterium]|nr:phosphatase [Actinomycetota bacterium]